MTMRLPKAVGAWSEDPLWAKVYPLLVEHPAIGAPLWRLGLGTDLTRLYAAAEEIGDLPHGARVLDVPAGSGVALRGLRAPALILAWRGDPVHPVATATRLSELLPRATLHVAATQGELRAWPARIRAD